MAKTTMKFLTWCWACGAHAYAKAYKLAKPCSGKLTEQGRLAVQRIRVGRAPRKVLGAPLMVSPLANSLYGDALVGLP